MTAIAAGPLPTVQGVPATRRQGLGAGLLITVVLVLVGLLLWFGRGDTLDRSPIGFAGLGTWLAKNQVPTITMLPSNGSLEIDRVLRILPLYDNDIRSDGEPYQPDSETNLGPIMLRQMSAAQFERKLAETWTLAILPKWRGGLLRTGTAHPDLLIPVSSLEFYDDSVRRLGDRGMGTYPLVAEKPSGERTAIGEASIYALQVLGPSLSGACAPILTIPRVGTLLAKCEDTAANGAAFYVLSDPDLLDNHGLALGENAANAPKIIGLLGKGPVFIDTGRGGDEHRDTDDTPTKAKADDRYDRSLSDLARFFAYPFSYAWIGVVLLAGLVLWRGNRRFGRAMVMTEDLAASKMRTVEASGRILQLTGTDRDLVDTHVRARIDALARTLMPGGTRLKEAETARIDQVLRRRAPDLADRFLRAQQAIAAAGDDRRARYDALDQFELTLQEIWNEFGRSASAQRPDRR